MFNTGKKKKKKHISGAIEIPMLFAATLSRRLAEEILGFASNRLPTGTVPAKILKKNFGWRSKGTKFESDRRDLGEVDEL